MIQSNYAKAYPSVEAGVTIVENGADRRKMVDSSVNRAIRSSLGELKRFLTMDKSILNDEPSPDISRADANKLRIERARLIELVDTNNRHAAKFNSEFIEKDVALAAQMIYRYSVSELAEAITQFENITHFDPSMVYAFAIAANVNASSFVFKSHVNENDRKNMLNDFKTKKSMCKAAIKQFVENGGNITSVSFIAKVQQKLYKKTINPSKKVSKQQQCLTILGGVLSDMDLTKTPYKDLITSAILSQEIQCPKDLLQEQKAKVDKQLAEFDPDMVQNIAKGLLNLDIINKALKDNLLTEELKRGVDDIAKIIRNFSSPDIDYSHVKTSREGKGLIYLKECAERAHNATLGQ